MVGKPQFDRAQVLARAAQVFSEHGYAGTSISALVEETGLLRGSLYAAFGSKGELFRLAYHHVAHEEQDRLLIVELTVVALRERSKLDSQVASTVTHVFTWMQARGICAKEEIFRSLLHRGGFSESWAGQSPILGEMHG